jgi:hypothetical protein
MGFGRIDLQTSLNQEKWQKTGFVHNSIKRTQALKMFSIVQKNDRF